MNYKEEYELEIDLKDLFFDIVYQWRIILLVAVIFCVAAGGYAIGHNAMIVPKETLALGEHQETEVDQAGADTATETQGTEGIKKLSPVKYAVLGFLAGCFGVAFLVGIFYVLSDKIRGERELRERYGYYLLGTVPKLQKKKFLSGIDRALQKLEEGTGQITEEEAYGIITANIRNLSLKDSIILVTGTVEIGKLKRLMERIAPRIEGVTLVEGADMTVTAGTLERLASCDSVILVEERDKSRRARIHREQESIDMLKKTVIGYVML